MGGKTEMFSKGIHINQNNCFTWNIFYVLDVLVSHRREVVVSRETYIVYLAYAECLEFCLRVLKAYDIRVKRSEVLLK